jgi:Methylmalonyl Co-A mutase-associated GTPase MeaB
MVDFFLLLLSPAAGDELQGIKRGVMELADGVLVHKADGDLGPAAERAAQQCLLAMRVLHAGEAEPPSVVLGSSVTGRGLDEVWQTIAQRLAARQQSGAFAARRTRRRGCRGRPGDDRRPRTGGARGTAAEHGRAAVAGAAVHLSVPARAALRLGRRSRPGAYAPILPA